MLSQPTLRREGNARLMGASSKEEKRTELPPTFIWVKREKNPKDDGLRILKMRVQELFTHGKGITTPRTHNKGRQPLIECAKHDFKIMYFPFLCFFFMYFSFLCFFFYLFAFLCFFTFWGRQRSCTRSYVSSGVMRKSDLRSSLKKENYA